MATVNITSRLDCGVLGERDILVTADFSPRERSWFDAAAGVGDPGCPPSADILQVEFIFRPPLKEKVDPAVAAVRECLIRNFGGKNLLALLDEDTIGELTEQVILSQEKEAF